MFFNIVKKIGLVFSGAILVLFFVYILLPGPAEIPPPPWGLRSVEPGDTSQMPGVSAYYTDVEREDVVDYYFSYYSKSSFLNLPLFTIKLNHPPELAREVLYSTQKSSYVEEIVHPFRESLFISGYEWDKDPFTKPEKRVANKSVVRNHEWKMKVTLIQRRSDLPVRIILVIGLFFVGRWIIREIITSIREFRSL